MTEQSIYYWPVSDLINYKQALETMLEGGEDSLLPLIDEEIEMSDYEEPNLNWKENSIWIRTKINEIDHILNLKSPPIVPKVPKVLETYGKYFPEIITRYESNIRPTPLWLKFE